MEQNFKIQFSPLIPLFCIFNLWLKGYEDLGCTTSTEEKKENPLWYEIFLSEKRDQRDLEKPLTAILPFSSFLSCSLQKFSLGQSKQGGGWERTCFYWHGKEKKDVKRKQNEPPFPPEVDKTRGHHHLPWSTSWGGAVLLPRSPAVLFAGSETFAWQWMDKFSFVETRRVTFSPEFPS